MKLKDLLPSNLLIESGIRDIRQLAKEYKEAEVYFHMDLDGVTSAIAIKAYLERYGIKVVDCHHIQYGGKEFSVVKPVQGRMAVMVDFAHGKPTMNIHTDHHKSQTGVEKSTSHKFKPDPSNAQTISQEISPTDLFPPADIKLISMIDSAQYAKYQVEADEVLKVVFGLNKSLSLERNRIHMALAVNKILLGFKNKPNFLEKLVMEAKPSLISLFTTIKNVVSQMNLSIEDMDAAVKRYIASQSVENKAKNLKSVNDITTLRSGEYAMFGKCLVQYAGGDLFKGGYDRYVPFKMAPAAEYFVMAWPMGLLQASKNPFKEGENPVDLNDIANTVLEKYRGYLQGTEVSFLRLKKISESDILKKGSKDSYGYTFKDLIASLKDKAKNIPPDTSLIEKISDKHFSDLTPGERTLLHGIKVTAWDVIRSQSGGHRNITNISGIGILGSDQVSFLKRLMVDMVKELRKHRLV